MGYKRRVDKKMKDSGETDFNKKSIRVNPKKGGLLNTILHEELHRTNPNKPEKWVAKKAKTQEEKLTVPKAIKLLKRYK